MPDLMYGGLHSNSSNLQLYFCVCVRVSAFKSQKISKHGYRFISL